MPWPRGESRGLGTVGGISYHVRRHLVRNILQLTGLVCVLSVWAIPWAAAQQPKTVPTTAPAATVTTMDDVLQAIRGDLQNDRADILAKNMSLTSEQAAKFWPMYEKYQSEQNVIMDDQLRGIQRYIESYETLDDAGALGLINGHFDRDARMNTLRQKWFGDFQKVLGTKLAVRAMQIDRRLSLVHQIQFASRIPLVH
jgi:Spy/CpxP family protein refolding chaperone